MFADLIPVVANGIYSVFNRNLGLLSHRLDNYYGGSFIFANT